LCKNGNEKYYTFEELKETEYAKKNRSQFSKYERTQNFIRFDGNFGKGLNIRIINQGNSGYYDPESYFLDLEMIQSLQNGT
jgi:hypothetical protein